MPQVSTIGFLVNPKLPDSSYQSSEMQEAADALGVKLVLAQADSENDFEFAFSSLLEKGAGVVLIESAADYG